MNVSGIYNLEEFIEQNNIVESFGSAIACFTANQKLLRQMVRPGTASSFYSLILQMDGWEQYHINKHQLNLEINDLLVNLPYVSISFDGCSNEVSSMHLLIEKNYFDELFNQNEQLRAYCSMDIFYSFPIMHLNETKTASFFQNLEGIRKTIHNPHLYKGEMIRYQVNILQLMLVELLSGEEVNTHDLKHKDNILKIFLHLASSYFKKERQVQFYADRMNISPTYLSRTVRELTGNTVFGYLSNFLFNEICIQLKTTDKTISEIADDLNFNSQSALTNFFRSKAGISPLTYRKKKR